MTIENKNFKIISFISNPVSEDISKITEENPVIGYNIIGDNDKLIGRVNPCRISFGYFKGVDKSNTTPFLIRKEKTNEIINCNYIGILDFPDQKGESLMDVLTEYCYNSNIETTWKDLFNALLNKSTSFLDKKIKDTIGF